MSPLNFLAVQTSHPRVLAAKTTSDTALKSIFQQLQFNYPPAHLYLRAFKKEKILEAWIKNENAYHLLKVYSFTGFCGNPGPKQREGDLQIPEGFYHITHFNPESKFHLSMRINYPNAADLLRNKDEQNIGNDIYIHGGSQTTGCIPIGDENIAELYWLCVQAFAINMDIPMHIFPCKMEENPLHTLAKEFPAQMGFWKSIKPTYDYFEKNKKLDVKTAADENGYYKC